MQQVDIIIKQIVMLSMLGLIGFFSGKFRYLPENSGMVLSRVVVKLTMPFLILTTMTGYSFSREVILNGIWIYVLGLVFLLFSYIVAVLLSNALKLKGSATNIYRLQSMFGNIVFLGFPLLEATFGKDGVIYAVFFYLANDTLLWTLGIYLLNKHNKTRWRDNLGHLFNANTVAFTLGIISIAVNFQNFVASNEHIRGLYDVFYNTFHPLGKTTIYLSMIFIGLILSEVKISGVSDIIKRYPLFILTFAKLLLVPAVAFALLTLLGGTVSPFVKTIVILELAMPSGTIGVALAAQYNSDHKFATESVFVTTLFSLVTLPFIVYILSLFKLF